MDNNKIINNLTKKLKLIENNIQLSDNKKTKLGFKLDESVIDVEQDGYGVSYGNDILYTYGIEPCCGLVLYDENIRILFHLDGTITPEDVIEVTEKYNFSHDSMVIVIPGASCGIKGSFDYKKLEEIFLSKGYRVIEQRIPATFGFVTLDLERVTIGTIIDRSLDIVLPIIPKRIQKELNDNLTNLKEDSLNDINNNIGKSR